MKSVLVSLPLVAAITMLGCRSVEQPRDHLNEFAKSKGVDLYSGIQSICAGNTNALAEVLRFSLESWGGGDLPPVPRNGRFWERQKGAPLAEDEVIAIRGKSVVMMMRRSIAEQMAQKRGWRDIDPQNCWQEWQQARQQS